MIERQSNDVNHQCLRYSFDTVCIYVEVHFGQLLLSGYLAIDIVHLVEVVLETKLDGSEIAD